MMRSLAVSLSFALACSTFTLPAFAATECGSAMSISAKEQVTAECASLAAAPAAPEAGSKPAKTALQAVKDTVQRSANFIAKFKAGTEADAPVIVLLHGSGGDESSLMSLAAKAYPGAALLGIRGRVVQDGINRWYKRLTPTTFDQDDIRSEAQAFAGFMATAQKEFGFDLNKAVFIGYSNGANLLAALSMLHPELVQRAALLRPMMVLNKLPEVSLAKDSILMVPGKGDTTYGPFASGLEEAFAAKGASITNHTVDLGHLLGDADVGVVSKWMASLDTKRAAPKAQTLSASAD